MVVKCSLRKILFRITEENKQYIDVEHFGDLLRTNMPDKVLMSHKFLIKNADENFVFGNKAAGRVRVIKVIVNYGVIGQIHFFVKAHILQLHLIVKYTQVEQTIIKIRHAVDLALIVLVYGRHLDVTTVFSAITLMIDLLISHQVPHLYVIQPICLFENSHDSSRSIIDADVDHWVIRFNDSLTDEVFKGVRKVTEST